MLREYPGYGTIEKVFSLTPKQIGIFVREKSKNDLRDSIWEASIHGCDKKEIGKMRSQLKQMEQRLTKDDFKKMSESLDDLTQDMLAKLKERAENANAGREHKIKSSGGGSKKGP